MFDNSILNFLAFAAVLIGGLGGILGGVSIVLHAIAPRTKTTVDDQLAAGVDAAHAKLDQVLDLLRGVVPASSAPSTPIAPPSASSAPTPNPQAGRVALGVMAVLPLLMAVGIAVGAGACKTLGPAAADGLVAAIDCEAAHFSTQELIDATRLADGEVQHWLAGAAAPSTDAIAADLAPFDSDAKKCALAGILAGATAALTSSSASSGSGSSSAVAAQGLSSRASVAPPVAGDPVQVRAAVSAAARRAGWRPIRVAGAVL